MESLHIVSAIEKRTRVEEQMELTPAEIEILFSAVEGDEVL